MPALLQPCMNSKGPYLRSPKYTATLPCTEQFAGSWHAGKLPPIHDISTQAHHKPRAINCWHLRATWHFSKSIRWLARIYLSSSAIEDGWKRRQLLRFTSSAYQAFPEHNSQPLSRSFDEAPSFAALCGPATSSTTAKLGEILTLLRAQDDRISSLTSEVGNFQLGFEFALYMCVLGCKNPGGSKTDKGKGKSKQRPHSCS